MQEGETRVYESAEGDVEQVTGNLQQFTESVRYVVALGNEDAIACIPDLIEQVRTCNEQYLSEGKPQDLQLGQLCAWAARELLEKKYGPIQGVVSQAPVKKGRWQW